MANVLLIAALGLLLSCQAANPSPEAAVDNSTARPLTTLTPQAYLPLVAANWRRPWPTPGSATVHSDLSRPGSPLPALLEPNANLHPMWGGYLNDPMDWWQEEVDRWDEGTYFIKLNLISIEEGGTDLVRGPYARALHSRERGANVFVEIFRVPPSLHGAELCEDEGECAPASYEDFRDVLEALLTYLSVPEVVMPENQATQILHIANQPSLGLDGLHYIFWHEANSIGWEDSTAAWFMLYDYWIEAVRNVRNAYPEVNFKVGTELLGDNRLENRFDWHRNHQDLLTYLDVFLPFLNGSPPKDWDYEYRSQPPLDLGFYAFNPRSNLNHNWINDWPDGFYQQIQERFAEHGFDDLTYVAWSLQSGHLQVQAPLVPETPPDKAEVRYWGAERDSEIGAAAQVALQHDAERSPVIDLSYSWAEWLRDPRFNYGVNRDVVPEEYPLYRGTPGNGFAYGRYAKPTYNVMRMLGMQETIRVPAQITDGVSPAKRNYVGAVVTRDETGEHVVVLLWYYIPPEDLESAAGRRYEDLRAYADTHLRIDLELVLEGLGDGPYRLARYLVDETHSNGFHYRGQIAEAKAPAEEVNGWLPGNNPYGASVALEQVEERESVSAEGGAVRLRYAGVTPWTVMLVDLRPVADPDGDGFSNYAQ